MLWTLPPYREDITELDGIHKHLLTKLCPRDNADRSSHDQFMPSLRHQVQQPRKESTILHTSGVQPVDEALPLAPPTFLHNRPSILEDVSQGRSQSECGSQSVGLLLSTLKLKHIHHDPNKTIETTLSDKSSPSPSLLSAADSSTQGEAVLSEHSLSPPPATGELHVSDSMHGLVEEEDSERRQMASPEDAPTPLTGSRSGSLTNVSMCSEDSPVVHMHVVQSHGVETQSLSRQQMKTDLPGKLDENEQLASNSDSPSESSSISSSPQPTLETELEVADVDKRDTPPAPERFPTSATSRTSSITHQVATAPLDTITSMTTAISSIPHHTHTPPHQPTSGQETSPGKKFKKDSLTSEHPSTSMSDRTHEQAPPLMAPPPPLPTFQLPNFFMTPQQLEESMRSLRTGALSRAPPRTPHPPPTTTACTQCYRHCVPTVASHLKTLQEVRSYLDSRRTAATDRRPKAKEISAMETQRLARIFSS